MKIKAPVNDTGMVTSIHHPVDKSFITLRQQRLFRYPESGGVLTQGQAGIVTEINRLLKQRNLPSCRFIPRVRRGAQGGITPGSLRIIFHSIP
jgi:hypothetical protein